MVPQHIRGMYKSPQWFSVEAPTRPGQNYQRAVKALLLRGWNKSGAFAKSIELVKYANIVGHVMPKTVWEVSLGEREVTDLDFDRGPDGEVLDVKFKRRTIPHVRHNGPQLFVPDNFNLWQDPTGNVTWVLERIDSSLDLLHTTNKAFDGKLYQKLDQVTASKQIGAATSAGRPASSSSDHTLEELLEGIPRSYRQDPDHVELWQYWGYVPKDIHDYSQQENPTQWRLIIVANRDVVIRDVLCVGRI